MYHPNLDEPLVPSTDGEESDINTDKKKKPKMLAANLRRPHYVLLFLICYASLAISGWAIICLLKYRPLPYGSYSYSYKGDFIYEAFGSYVLHPAQSFQKRYSTNYRWYQAAQILQAIVAVLTLGMTSALCATSTIAYMQYRNSRLSLRQELALADKGWSNPATYFSLLRPSRRRVEGSLPLFIFMAVTVLGLLIPPLQQILVSEAIIRVPLSPRTRYDYERLADIPHVVEPPHDTKPSVTSDSIARLQNLLTDTTSADYIPYVWIDYDNTPDCSRNDGSLPQMTIEQCSDGPSQSYAKLINKNPSFITQLPSSINTGLVRQYSPRINSTVAYQKISPSEFPASCREGNSGFYTKFENGHPLERYSIEACMLSKQIDSPWKPTRDRQEITEELFINITWSVPPIPPTPSGHGVFKLQANTTLGYFELPNHFNGDKPGPLLDLDPFPCKDKACAPQVEHALRIRSENIPLSDSRHLAVLSNRNNIGPLTMVVEALFGVDSWLAFQTHLTDSGTSWPVYKAGRFSVNTLICAGNPPLITMITFSDSYASDFTCIKGGTLDDALDRALGFTNLFFYEKLVELSISGAVKLASHEWLARATRYQYPGLDLTEDPGTYTVIPSMSLAAIVILSAMLALYLFSLGALCYWSLSSKLWTHQLDAFTMMRIGAVMVNHVPLLAHLGPSTRGILDNINGRIGDAAPSEKIGTIEMGAKDPLNPEKRYRSYVLETKNV